MENCEGRRKRRGRSEPVAGDEKRRGSRGKREKEEKGIRGKKRREREERERKKVSREPRRRESISFSSSTKSFIPNLREVGGGTFGKGRSVVDSSF